MRTIVIASALLLTACGSSTPPPPPPPAQTAQPAAPATPGGIYDRELEKAKAVEGDVLQQKKDLDKAIDEQGN